MQGKRALKLLDTTEQIMLKSLEIHFKKQKLRQVTKDTH